jgi:serine/threonine-protein kinase HipA
MRNFPKDDARRKGGPMGESGKSIFVYAHWQGLKNPLLLGTLDIGMARGKEFFSFEYDKAWLESKLVHQLDPDLQLYQGRQYPLAEKPSFGLFLDSSPDRWGRLLMRRREAIQARHEGRKVSRLDESDFLLGVHDAARMGALRFKTEIDGPFLAEDSMLSTPPWASLRELEHAAGVFEISEDAEEEEQWLSVLLAPGSSLGGARPKASVLDPDGGLWIAKFPAHRDEADTGAWEMTVHTLALRAGLSVPEARLELFSKRGSTFLVKRFDRTPKGERIHFASAMTLLGKSDGASAQEGASYLELADLIMRTGEQPVDDLKELWKRIVFSIAVSNTDDHLRNHGFLLGQSGWRLSPAYDINPIPDGNGLSLNISEDDNSLDFGLALAQAPFYQLDPKRAHSLLGEIGEAVSGWRTIATGYGISRTAQNRMEKAFRIP